ncbi:MAG: transposase [Coprobacillaceae bacterium]
MIRKQYDENFKLKAVQLVNAGKTQTAVCIELDIPKTTLQQWIKKYDSQSNTVKASNLLSDEQKRIRELEKECNQLKIERDILKEAALIFGKK